MAGFAPVASEYMHANQERQGERRHKKVDKARSIASQTSPLFTGALQLALVWQVRSSMTAFCSSTVFSISTNGNDWPCVPRLSVATIPAFLHRFVSQRVFHQSFNHRPRFQSLIQGQSGNPKSISSSI
jgi:hypothetical protein